MRCRASNYVLWPLLYTAPVAGDEFISVAVTLDTRGASARGGRRSRTTLRNRDGYLLYTLAELTLPRSGSLFRIQALWRQFIRKTRDSAAYETSERRRRLRQDGDLMMRGLLLTAVLVFLVCFSPAATRAQDAMLVKLGGRINSFAFSMYSRLSSKPGNLFFSPYSVSTALTMTGLGAAGNTAREMSGVLRLNVGKAKVHELCGRLVSTLDSTSPDRSYTLCTANRLWGQKGFTFLPGFITTARRSYGAGMEELDFAHDPQNSRLTINKWVEVKTGRMIRNLLPPTAITPLTRMVLTNAVYFKGSWSHAFEESDTEELAFTTSSGAVKQAQLMSQVFKFHYAEVDGTQLLEMPYKGDELSMLVLLPGKGLKISGLEGKLDSSWLKMALPRLERKKVRVFFPKFRISWGKELNGTLTELGMKEAFTRSADFSKMTGAKDLYISKVIHKAFAEINEEGTKAAAATAVVCELKCRPPMPEDEPVLFKADHPFIFIIRHRKTGTIIFMGRMDDPANNAG